MNRRNFLQSLLGGAIVGAVATPALAELLAPKRTIFLPPRGGWGGVPEYLENYIDPEIVDMLIQPMHISMGYERGPDGHLRPTHLSIDRDDYRRVFELSRAIPKVLRADGPPIDLSNVVLLR
jgi:hypothetical protein